MRIKGTQALKKGLKESANLDDVKLLIKYHTSELENRMKNKASFTQGYQTGTTKRSINSEFYEDGMEGRVKPTTEYSPYLEYGTRKMKAQPFVGPAFYEQDKLFRKDLKRIMK